MNNGSPSVGLILDSRLNCFNQPHVFGRPLISLLLSALHLPPSTLIGGKIYDLISFAYWFT